MPPLVRKNVLLDPATLHRAQRILGRRTESETIRDALKMVTFKEEVARAYDRVAGQAPDYGKARTWK